MLGGLKSAGTKMTTFTKEGWGFVTKKIGLEFGKKVSQDVVRELINLGIDRALIPAIEKSITAIITPLITMWLKNNEKIKKMLEIDAKNRNSYYESQLMILADSIIHDQKNFIRKIAEQIAEKILDPNVIKQGNEITDKSLDYVNSVQGVETGTEIAVGIFDRVLIQKYPVYEKLKKIYEVSEILAFVPIFLDKFESRIDQDIKIEKQHLQLLESSENRKLILMI